MIKPHRGEEGWCPPNNALWASDWGKFMRTTVMLGRRACFEGLVLPESPAPKLKALEVLDNKKGEIII